MSCAQRLQNSFREGLALPPKYDATNADSNTLRQWDSVAHLQLLVAIEDEFGVRLSPSDIIGLKSYPAAIAILRRLGVWSDA
jgi:acyl carrier protein